MTNPDPFYTLTLQLAQETGRVEFGPRTVTATSGTTTTTMPPATPIGTEWLEAAGIVVMPSGRRILVAIGTTPG